MNGQSPGGSLLTAWRLPIHFHAANAAKRENPKRVFERGPSGPKAKRRRPGAAAEPGNPFRGASVSPLGQRKKQSPIRAGSRKI